jgi:hypothetical protein
MTLRGSWRAVSLVATVVSAAACGGGSVSDLAPSLARPPLAAREVVFQGMCDASGAVPLTPRLFAVADDEDNVIRIYDAERGGSPVRSHDLSRTLGVPQRGRRNPRPAETDLEAATHHGDRAYWITSHGRSRRGRSRPERIYLFATTTPRGGEALEVVGRPYTGLLGDLLEAPQLAQLDLRTAAGRAPKEPGGLNLEGLAAAPDGTLLLAFRNPIPGGRALIVPLQNPTELLEGTAERASLGAPILLDLDGLGIRALSLWRGRYLVIAGRHDSGGVSRLYVWDPGAAPRATNLDLTGYNPEGFFSSEERPEVLLLSDDGSVLIEGRRCKDLRDPAGKRFRAVWVEPPTA